MLASLGLQCHTHVAEQQNTLPLDKSWDTVQDFMIVDQLLGRAAHPESEQLPRRVVASDVAAHRSNADLVEGCPKLAALPCSHTCRV